MADFTRRAMIRTAALDLVRRGFTTVEEVNRVTIMA